MREIGVGITLLPHAMRELAALGLQPQLEALGIENLESVFFNRWGQFIYREPRGRHAGYELPEIGIHRGKLHRVLYAPRCSGWAPTASTWTTGASGVEQGAHGATLRFQDSRAGTARRWTRTSWSPATASIRPCGASSIREEQPAFAGINTWRGVTVHQPILTGKSYLRIGSIDTGKMVIYPIVDNVDGQGNQLINWVAEIRAGDAGMNDWNQPGRPEDFLPRLRRLEVRLAGRPGADHAARRRSSSTRWWTRTRWRAGPSAASPSWATRRTRCTRAAPTAARRR